VRNWTTSKSGNLSSNHPLWKNYLKKDNTCSNHGKNSRSTGLELRMDARENCIRRQEGSLLGGKHARGWHGARKEEHKGDIKKGTHLQIRGLKNWGPITRGQKHYWLGGAIIEKSDTKPSMVCPIGKGLRYITYRTKKFSDRKRAIRLNKTFETIRGKSKWKVILSQIPGDIKEKGKRSVKRGTMGEDTIIYGVQRENEEPITLVSQQHIQLKGKNIRP